MVLPPCRYILYERTGTPEDYTARRMPEVTPEREKWPPLTTSGCPYSVITDKVMEVMKDTAYELHVTGHR